MIMNNSQLHNVDNILTLDFCYTELVYFLCFISPLLSCTELNNAEQ